MADAIQFRNKTYPLLKLKIQPKAEFNQILKILNEIQIPDTTVNLDHIIYAILELINNSLRAHREKAEDRPIELLLGLQSQHLQIVIKDFGGGFDVSNLPYDFTDSPDSIDTNSPAFLSYREKNQYMRFGMGLYMARKTFTDFSIQFFEGTRKSPRWEPGKTEGTLITLGVAV